MTKSFLLNSKFNLRMLLKFFELEFSLKTQTKPKPYEDLMEVNKQ